MSVEKLNSKSTNSEVSQIVRLMYDANERLNDFGTPENYTDYLKKTKEIQRLIVSSTSLSEKDRSMLQKELTNITKKKQSKSTIEISRQQKYRDADRYFRQNLPSVFRDEALRQYFYESQGKDLDRGQQINIMRGIETKILYSKRQDVLDVVDRARETYGADADIRVERSKEGDVVIVLYRNGKRFKIRTETEGE